MKKSGKILVVLLALVIVALAGYIGYEIATTKKFEEIKIENVPEITEDMTRVMSFNLRRKNDEAGNVNSRAKIACEIIRSYAPDSFGIQEGTTKWLFILNKEFGDIYDSVGKARDWYGPFSEYCNIFYRKDKYNLIDSGTSWLSETPEKRSVSFESACYRIAVWAVLENKETGVRYTHINTHLDHVLESTRVAQAGVFLNMLEKLQTQGSVVITGDFNAYEDSEVYASMLEVMNDGRLVAKNSDEGITFHNYGKIKEGSKSAIDFAFVSRDTEVENYKIIRDTADGMYPSDHYPLIVDIYPVK